MNQQFRLFVVLFCLSKINGERSIYGIFHLLQGKKSSQTIQDAKLFQLESFFQMMPQLSKKELEDAVSLLETKEYIHLTTKDTYTLTKEGMETLQTLSKKFPIPAYLNGWRYHKKSAVFWQRLSLTIQSLSNLIYDCSSFIPVLNDEETQRWVKGYIKNMDNRQHRADMLFEELKLLLKQLPPSHAQIFVLHISSFHRVGYTLEQISHILELEAEYTLVLFQSILHFMIEKIVSNQGELDNLRQFLEYEQTNDMMTESSQKTYEWLKKNKSISEIAGIRQLKESTIEDHIVEIASVKMDFLIEPYISSIYQRKITETIQTLGTKRLKPIRTALDDQVSYFQIRLVLGRMGK